MERKKINILTFNRALSYGAILQAYALVRVLESLDFDVEIIDFQAPFLPPRPTGIWSLKTYYGVARIRKELMFRTFHRKYLTNKTKAFYTLKSLQKHKFDADFYIVGSDQVWNPDITKNYMQTYFLDFVDGIKISYAASFGKGKWETNEKSIIEISNLLSQFNSISVREANGLGVLRRYFEMTGEQVLDPTLLYKDFSELSTGSESMNEGLVCYNVNHDNRFLDMVDSLSEKLNLSPVILGRTSNDTKYKSLPYTSVINFLRYMAGSRFVFTDSYHGVIFSILYRKDFLVINNHPERFDRILDLLEHLNLKDRIINYSEGTVDEHSLKMSVDYINVYRKLESLREKSMDFLKESLSVF
jgi:hypothetical protein